MISNLIRNRWLFGFLDTIYNAQSNIAIHPRRAQLEFWDAQPMYFSNTWLDIDKEDGDWKIRMLLSSRISFGITDVEVELIVGRMIKEYFE